MTDDRETRAPAPLIADGDFDAAIVPQPFETDYDERAPMEADVFGAGDAEPPMEEFARGFPDLEPIGTYGDRDLDREEAPLDIEAALTPEEAAGDREPSRLDGGVPLDDEERFDEEPRGFEDAAVAPDEARREDDGPLGFDDALAPAGDDEDDFRGDGEAAEDDEDDRDGVDGGEEDRREEDRDVVADDEVGGDKRV